MARLRGALSNEYQIIAELGRGGFASVLLARDLALNRRVALKVMSPSVLMGEGMLERAQQEAVTHANLTHPNIVPVYGLRVVEDLFLIVMQYVPGRSLQQVIREEYGSGRLLSVGVIRAVLYMVGTALAYAHRRGVVHRDIKPANILLSGDGEAIVTDFGIAKVSEASSHTQTGTVVGTAQYMSPEQCYAAKVTGASDQYALGIVAFELLTGTPPFSGNSFAVMQAQTMRPPPSPSSYRPDCPPEMDAAILKMLAKEPGERFPTLPDALAALGATPVSTLDGDAVRAALVDLAAVDEVASRLSGIMVPISPLIGRTPAVADVRRDSGMGATAAGPSRNPKAALPARVSINLAKPSLETGEELALVATVLSSAGDALPDTPVEWRSSDPSVVAIDGARGVLVAHRPGRADVIASAGDAVTALQLEVRPARVVQLLLDGPVSLEVGERATWTARAIDARSRALEVRVQWASDQPAIVTVDAQGGVLPKAAGEATITIRAGDVTTRRALRVVPARPAFVRITPSLIELAAGERARAQATVTDKLGAAVHGAQVTWQSADPQVARVDATGGVTATEIGETVLLAQAGDAVGEVAVAVRPGVVTQVEVQGLETPLPERRTRQLAARALDRTGRVREVPVMWETSDASIATVTPAGQLTARAPGETLVTVRCASVEKSLPLRVEAVVPVGQHISATMGAAARRVSGKWLAGIVVLIAAGIVAVLLSQRTPAPAPSPVVLNTPTLPLPEPEPESSARPDILVLTPVRVQLVLPRSLAINESRVATVEVQGLPASAPRRFASSDARVASVDGDGRVTARSAGVARITVSVDTVTAIATLRVTTRDSATVTPVRLVLQPREVELEVGGATLIRASVSGATAAEVEWASENPAVATVDRSGRVSALGPGNTTIVARINDVRERVLARVSDAAVTRVVVEGTRTLKAGERATLTARTVTATGATAAVRVTWTSRNPAVATVEPNGNVHALAPGNADIVASVGGVSSSLTVSVERTVADPPPPDRADLSQDVGLALAQQCLAALKGGQERVLSEFAPSEARTRLLDGLSRNGTVAGGLDGLSVDPAGRADFRVEARSRDAFGRSQTLRFSVSAVGRRDGARWTLESCQIR